LSNVLVSLQSPVRENTEDTAVYSASIDPRGLGRWFDRAQSLSGRKPGKNSLEDQQKRALFSTLPHSLYPERS
jgi:hypothetical protein